jgi:hypothetical protein
MLKPGPVGVYGQVAKPEDRPLTLSNLVVCRKGT